MITPRRMVGPVLMTLVLAMAGGAGARAQADRTSRFVWSSREGLVPRSAAAADSRAVAGEPLRFLEPCLTLAERTGGGGAASTVWVQVARRSAPRVAAGWVDRRDLLIAPAAEIDPASSAPRMVIIANTVMSLQTPGSEEWLEVALRKAPEKEAPPAGSVRIMELFFRYATAGGYVLVGPEPRFAPEADGGRPGKAIAGWVSEELVVPFDGRFAVTWDRGSTLPVAPSRRPTPAFIYLSPGDAYDAPKTPRDPLFEEQADEDGVSLLIPPSIPRMPVLPYPDDDLDHPKLDPLTRNELFKVVAMGAMLPRGVGPPTRAEKEKIDAELARIRDHLTRPRQILFVIDDTASMGDQFPRVAEAVRKIIEDALRNPERVVEVAVSYYNDVDCRPPGYQPMQLINAGSAEGFRLREQVRIHASNLVRGNTFPELVFDGLEHALDVAGFEARPRADRLVFLIGDHGNRGEPAYDRLVEKLTLPGRGPIELVVIQVVDPDKPPKGVPDQFAPDAEKAARDFRDQMNELIRRLNRRAPDATRPLGKYKMLADEGASLTEFLDQTYDELKDREEKAKQDLARLTARSFPTKVGAEMETVLSKRGVPVDKIGSLAGVRLGQAGFVWRWSSPPKGGELGVPQVREEALLGFVEVKKLIAALDPVLSAPDPLAALRLRAGNAPDATFEGVVMKPSGFPARAALLRYPVATLDPEQVRAELPATREKLDRLRALAQPTGSPPRFSPRWFHLRDGTEAWCWIDVETELP